MEKSLYRNKKRHHVGNFVRLFLIAVLFIAVYTYILQRNYSQNTQDAAVERDIACSDAIHKVVSNRFTQEDFLEINTREDMDSSRYKQLQESLNELRTLNSTRYLYTAKRGADGKLIYLVDGLDLGADDFAYPGTYIEEEMIPYIESALSGETIYSQEIVDTTWGHIFTAWPYGSGAGKGLTEQLPLVSHHINGTVFINGNAVGDPIHLVPVMGHEQHRAVIFPQGTEQLTLQLPAQVGVQRREGLIQHYDAGLANEHSGQRTSLLLAAGELTGGVMLQTFQMEFSNIFGNQRRVF